MLALEVRFLTGRYVATRFNDRELAEWPPHPARVYSALVAALYDDPEHDGSEREALQWLAKAGAPDVIASDCGYRRQSIVYVPTNDAAALPSIDKPIQKIADASSAARGAQGKAQDKANRKLQKAIDAATKRSRASAAIDGKGTADNARALLFEGRPRQPRHFPVAIPHEDVVHLRWAVEASATVAKALDRVASRVARLGHSSSLVSMRVTDPDLTLGERTHWIPSERGELLLRSPAPGQLERLDEAHARFQQVEPRILPANFVRYADAQRQAEMTYVEGSTFAPERWLVFEVVSPPEGGRRRLLDISLGSRVARAMRGTLLSNDERGWPPALSGHGTEGGPKQGPHLAYVPLAHVGHRHASGSILGVALVPPRDLSPDDWRFLLETVALAEAACEAGVDNTEPPALRLTLGRRGTLHLRRLRDLPSVKTLRASRWNGPATRWATVTAIALDRNPGDLSSRDARAAERAIDNAEECVVSACENLGLPRPAAVWVHRRSLVDGAPEARRFMPYPLHGNGPRRVCVHAELVFDEPVRGPIILGAGRYFGLGLCIAHGSEKDAR